MPAGGGGGVSAGGGGGCSVDGVGDGGTWPQGGMKQGEMTRLHRQPLAVASQTATANCTSAMKRRRRGITAITHQICRYRDCSAPIRSCSSSPILLFIVYSIRAVTIFSLQPMHDIATESGVRLQDSCRW